MLTSPLRMMPTPQAKLNLRDILKEVTSSSPNIAPAPPVMKVMIGGLSPTAASIVTVSHWQ